MPIISDLLLQPVKETDWLIYPILGRESITFFHGRRGLGKTPFALEIGRCISVGSAHTSFGLEVRGGPGRVLYLEAETALRNMLPRLHLLPEPRGDWWFEDFYAEGANVLDPRHPCMPKLRDLSRKLSPDLVVWSSVRRFARGDLSDSNMAVSFYQSIVNLFPPSAHLVIGHDKKDSQEPEKDNPDDAFNGSAAWVDQANVGLHMIRKQGKGEGIHTLLEITKSQLGPSKDGGGWPPFRLHLDQDGMTWHGPGEMAGRIAELWDQAPPGQDIGKWVASQLGISRASVYRIKSGVSQPEKS